MSINSSWGFLVSQPSPPDGPDLSEQEEELCEPLDNSDDEWTLFKSSFVGDSDDDSSNSTPDDVDKKADESQGLSHSWDFIVPFFAAHSVLFIKINNYNLFRRPL